MIHPPAVIIHGLAQASVALAPALPVTLLSARGAAQYAGCAWWREIVVETRQRHARTRIIDILDCADAPGRAMAALRIGQRLLVLDPCPASAEVAAAAASVGAVILARPPSSLDLAVPGAARRLGEWLAQDRDSEFEVR